MEDEERLFWSDQNKLAAFILFENRDVEKFLLRFTIFCFEIMPNIPSISSKAFLAPIPDSKILN
jgi:hypothetical protein